jgi:hypothetical protein
MIRNAGFSLVLSLEKTGCSRFSIVLNKNTAKKLCPILSNKRLFSRLMLIAGFVLALGGGLQAQETKDDSLKAQGVSSKLKGLVEYDAHDSMKFDIANQVVYLWDSAHVDYEDINLSAHYVIIDFKNNLLVAEGKKDSAGNYLDQAAFTDGGQTFYAQKISYNYLTGKGKIEEVSSVQGDGYLLAHTAKKDSSNVINVLRGQYTTCDLSHPHFAIRARKLKVIPDDKIVTGPAYLEISDVPTPLAIPFGFFPNKRERTSGILIPTYGESPSLGFFLRDGGYYWGISDKIDLALRGDIYSRGSWGAKIYTNYKVRYKYSGNFNAKYSQILTGERELPTRALRKDFFVVWSHIQDPKFNPSIRFSANVNAGSGTYQTFNAINANNYLANTFQSNIVWAKSWKFGTLSTNLRHSQNTQTRVVDLTLPQVAFTANRFYPFRNNELPSNKWYEKIGLAYTADFQNNLNIVDSLLFKMDSVNNIPYAQQRLRNGIRQNIPMTASFNVLRYFSLTPAANINTVTHFKTIRKTWDADAEQIVIDTLNNTRTALDWNANLTLGTRIYGTFNFKRTKFSKMRHTLTPNLILSYVPDFRKENYSSFETVQTSSIGRTEYYSVFDGGVFGASPTGRIGSLGFNLLNSLEAKMRPRPEDSTDVEERRMLIDALNVSMNYNFMAENFNWSPVTASFRTRLFKRVDVLMGVTADPYRIDSLGTRIERFEWRTGKRLARLTRAGISLNTSLRQGGLTSQPQRNSTRGTQEELNYINNNPNQYVDFTVPWSLNLAYNLDWSRPGITDVITQTFRFSGDVNVTPKWKVGFDSNYDLVRGEFGFTSFNVFRDLHCWEMQFNWIPFGFRQSYNVTIQVKSSVLQDLKLSRKRDWYDFSAQ